MVSNNLEDEKYFPNWQWVGMLFQEHLIKELSEVKSMGKENLNL